MGNVFRQTVLDRCNDLQYVLCWLFVVLADPDVEECVQAENVCSLERALEVPRGLVEVSSGAAKRRVHPTTGEHVR